MTDGRNLGWTASCERRSSTVYWLSSAASQKRHKKQKHENETTTRTSTINHHSKSVENDTSLLHPPPTTPLTAPPPSSPSRIPQPPLLKHKLKNPPPLSRINMTDLPHILLLKFALLLHGLAENILLDSLVSLGLQPQFSAEVFLGGIQELQVWCVLAG